MSPNIQHLVDQAEMKTDISGKWIDSDGFDQFTELLIDKCAEISYNKTHGIDAAKAIKQHFGVRNEDI